jgi:RecB family exonuclease
MKPTRWSYSSLSTYEECPAKWRYSYIDNLPDPPSPAMERGTRLHKLCEAVLTDGVETPAELASIARVLDRLKVNGAQSEKAWRLNAAWEPVESKSWVIGIIDVHFLKDGALHVYDFKSGKPYASHKKQLELYALIGLAVYPQAERAECGAIYIDSGKIGYKRTIPRAEVMQAQADWSERAERLFADSALAASPGRGCYWCAFKDSLGGPCSAWRAA